MWLYGSTNPMAPKFEAAKKQAANLTQPGEQGTYSKEMFLEDFPQFTDLLPEGILTTFLTQVNDSVLPSRWGSMWRYAAGLYLAHFAAMYLKTYAPESSGAAQAAAKAQPAGEPGRMSRRSWQKLRKVPRSRRSVLPQRRHRRMMGHWPVPTCEVVRWHSTGRRTA